mgnify:CR=1 FL=1
MTQHDVNRGSVLLTRFAKVIAGYQLERDLRALFVELGADEERATGRTRYSRAKRSGQVSVIEAIEPTTSP